MARCATARSTIWSLRGNSSPAPRFFVLWGIMGEPFGAGLGFRLALWLTAASCWFCWARFASN